ncbi:MAG: ABC transporter ATP-binding protein [Pseudomonadota bacterium]
MMPALTVRGLEKVWPGGQRALNGIDLQIEAGDFYALLGPNGAGKSTAIGIVSSLVAKSAGRVSVFGHDLDVDAYAVRRAIGLVPQEFNMNTWEVIREVLINQAGFYGVPRRTAITRADESLAALGLYERRFDHVRQLSGGMRRRLMIARALVHRPQLLILDEPTAGVDIEIRRATWDLLRALNGEGTTILLTTHYLEEAEALCRTVAIIDQGRIIEQGPVADLLSQAVVQTFVFDLAEPIDQAPQFDGMTCALEDDSGLRLRVSVARDVALNSVFSALSQVGVAVVSMRNHRNRLEEFFLRRIAQAAPHD